MSEPAIIEAADTRNELTSEKSDAQMPTDEEQGIDIRRALPEMVVEVEEVVDELQALCRALPDNVLLLHNKLPASLSRRIQKLLSREGLEGLPNENRQEARLRILESLGLCLEHSRWVTFIDRELIGESELSPAEVEALYRRLELSTALEVVSIDIPANASENWEPESWRLFADILVGAQSLEEVRIEDQPLSGLALFQLARAVAASGRGPSPVRRVTITHGRRGLQSSRETRGSFTEEWAGIVANLNAAAPSLKTLTIELGPFADDDVTELIGEAISLHQSLETLAIVDKEGADDTGQRQSDGRGTSVQTVSSGKKKMDAFDRLLSRAFLVNPCNTSINSLDVDYRGKGASSGADLQIFCQVLQMNSHITEFALVWDDDFLAGDLRDFLNTLPVNGAHLQSLVLRESWQGPLPKVGGPERLGFDRDSFAMLVEILRSNSMPGLKHLTLSLGYTSDYTIKAFDWPGLYSSLGQLESVSLYGYVRFGQAEKEISEWITTSKGLQKLTIWPDGKINWTPIFRSLKENSTVRYLTITDDAVEDDAAYRELMEVLQVNSTLQEVEFEPSGGSSRAAAVREALKGKARQESYLAELQKGLGGGRAKWQSPKCGRVFLCGAPEAGKTRLTRSMLKLAQGKSWVKKLKEKLRRTEGVEIHTLRNDEEMQILVWDLAGQDIFRALQQFLFPRLSRASLFIFVFSPFSESSATREMKQKRELEKAFRKELVQWLRFIASNSAVTGFNVPQVMIVISHRDIYQSNDVDVKWSEKILTKLINDFQDVVYIHPSPHFVDGCDSRHVKPILDGVYSIFNELFERKLFKVPTACSHLSQHLVRWASKNPEKPVIDDKTFFSLCGSVSDFQVFSQKCHEKDNKRLLQAVGSYLHDVGTIIDMTGKDEIQETQENHECNLIVVNPNWLTHVFLGRFICFGKGFQLSLGDEIQWMEYADGFLCGADFQQLLRTRFLLPMKKQFSNLTLQMLQDLMQNLDLLYITKVVNEQGHSDRFFIPTLFKYKSEQILHWHENAFPPRTGLIGEISFLGLRLCCKDSKRTYLSTAFFSRFQVTFWRKLKEELHLSNALIECKFNLISVLVDGLDIRIENDEDGDFIDVLIKSNRSRKTVWEFAEKQIVNELRGFCSSSKGCPGVELVMHIIRTECVKRLTSCKHRKGQSVSRRNLKRTLMLYVEKLGPNSEEEHLPLHTWMPVPEALLGASFEHVVELLPPEDVHTTYVWIEGQMQSLQQKVIRVEDVSNLIDSDNAQLRLGGHSSQISNLLETKKCLRSRSDQWVNPIMQSIQDLKQDVRRGIQDVKGDVRRVGEDVKQVLVEVRDLRVQIQEMNRLQRKEAEKVTLMYDKLDQLMGNSMWTTEWPKRPYFTHKDVSVSHKITAVVEIAKPLILHFECEERDGHHFVPKQPGYAIKIGRENCEALRQISKTSVRVLWYLLKAGLHISTGMGDLVPELQTPDGNTTKLTSLTMGRLLHKVQLQDSPTWNQTGDCCSPEEAWRYLQDFLRSDLKDKITEHFLLHPAQYLDSKSTHAWLCQRCLETGLEGNKIKKL